ncbi:MAG TPA: PAC2 family protein [Nitrososphaeraceae archaeon]|jgi:proteasome assembly chaperone (PAC2) family protein|nr:PAC2 family protein [Nitrososphaeraceae archaeon]
MFFVKLEEPFLQKPIIIAAMQDMGNVGSIAIDAINKSLKTRPFRHVYPPSPNYVIDNGGYVDFQQEKWEYRYTKGVIIFGGGTGQPQTNQELYELCQDIIDIAKMYSAQLIYTLGAFHTNRVVDKKPETFVTSTSRELTEQIIKFGIQATPQSSLITGFNGLMLGFAKINNIKGIGLYGELNDPRIQQYRAAKSVLQILERLTYQRFGNLEELDVMAEAVDKEIEKMKKNGEYLEK